MAMMRTTIKKKKSSPSKNACRLIGLVFFLEKWKVDFLLVSTKLEYFIFRKKVCQFFLFFRQAPMLLLLLKGNDVRSTTTTVPIHATPYNLGLVQHENFWFLL